MIKSLFNFNKILIALMLVLFLLSLLAGKFDLASFFFLIPIFMISLILPGYAIISYSYQDNLSTMEKLSFSFAATVALYAVITVAARNIYPNLANIINFSLFCLINLSAGFYLIKNKSLKELFGEKVRRFLLFFLSFIFFLQALISLPIFMPKTLPDGPYVFKNTNLHVKIQRLTGDLPADNYIPYVFSQFLLRGVSFTANKPMLPGQEVVNRTVLMGLDSAFYLSFLSPVKFIDNQVIGTFNYVGVNWPDVGEFGYNNYSFGIYQLLAMMLNAIFIFPVYLLCVHFFKNKEKVLGGIILLFILPFIVNQTIFVWPKFFMAYFLLNGLYLVVIKKYPYLMAFMLAMAFHAHPLAIIYIISIVLYWLVANKKELLNSKFLRSGVFAGLIGIIILLPWFIWTKYILKIPSDLISQNVGSTQIGLSELLKVRVNNLILLLVPWQNKGISLGKKFFSESILSIPGSMLLYVIPFYYLLIKCFKKYMKEIILLIFFPVATLTLLWGWVIGGFAIIFGQPLVPIIYLMLVLALSEKKISTTLNICQGLMGITIILYLMYPLAESVQSGILGRFGIATLLVIIVMALVWLFSAVNLLKDSTAKAT